MSGAWDDWEQADEAEIVVPVVVQKPVKRTSTPVTPMILQRNNSASNHDRMGPTLLRRGDSAQEQERSLHEQNRALWDKANAHEQPIIYRDDSHQRTEYVPEIKILRRPKSPVTTVKVGRTQPKSLAQREADYNAAREKIFGPSSTTSASTSPSQSPTPTSTKPPTSTANARSSPALHPGLASMDTSGCGSSSGSKSRSDRGSPTPARSPTSVRQGRQKTNSLDMVDVPPTGRVVHGSSTKAMDTAIRQPQGPPMVASSSPATASSREGKRGGFRGGGGGGSGSRTPRQQEGGSIGFRNGPFRGASRPSPQSDPSL